MTEENKPINVITYNDDTYELKYNLKTIQTIERLTKKSLMSALYAQEAMLSLDDLQNYFAQALFKVGGAKVSPAQGVDIFEAVLKEKGYAFVNMLVVAQIQHDCPFFFQVD